MIVESILEIPAQLEQILLEKGYRLQMSGNILQLVSLQGSFGPLYIDFVSGKLAHRRLYGGGKNQPLARAIGIKGQFYPDVLDLTAGMGRDAFVLATLGCQVTMLERSGVIAALLANALDRAELDEETAPIVQKLKLIQQDSFSYLQDLPESSYPTVIYMDPMYPHRNKSALVKKEMRIFRDLVGSDSDSDGLLFEARNKVGKRVVVKRPKGADFLSGCKPHSQISSKNTRYDIYLPLTAK